MPRPQKFTVDYFSHDANASVGKTLTILFNAFGHEGISAWWQLLERLASTNNHIINTKNLEDFEYLSGQMNFQPERLKEILNKMANLEAIDKELYSIGLVWSQNFVDRLEPVYRKRNQNLPKRPDITYFHPMVKVTDNPVSATDNPVSATDNPVSATDNTQTKESKLKKGTKETKAEKKPLKKTKKNDSSKKDDELPAHFGSEAGSKPGKAVALSRSVTTETEFLEYLQETKNQFPDLDCEVEYKKFTLWWSEGKKPLLRPKTAWLNWLTKARDIKQKEAQVGASKRNSQSLIPRKQYTRPEDYRGGN